MLCNKANQLGEPGLSEVLGISVRPSRHASLVWSRFSRVTGIENQNGESTVLMRCSVGQKRSSIVSSLHQFHRCIEVAHQDACVLSKPWRTRVQPVHLTICCFLWTGITARNKLAIRLDQKNACSKTTNTLHCNFKATPLDLRCRSLYPLYSHRDDFDFRSSSNLTTIHNERFKKTKVHIIVLFFNF